MRILATLRLALFSYRINADAPTSIAKVPSSGVAVETGVLVTWSDPPVVPK